MNYLLGLDIGIASVGYAICSLDGKQEVNSLIDCGVRTFDKAEVPKTGASLNAQRREYRGKRRLIRRKRSRLYRLKSFLFENGIVSNFDKDNNIIKGLLNNPWELRVQALDRKLTNIEFATILIHLLKHRGYKVVRKSELKDTKDEKGEVLGSIQKNSKSLSENKYRTCAEMAICEFQEKENHIRNKQGKYNHCFGRKDLLNEFNMIIDKQQEFQNVLATDELKDKFIEIFEYQKEPLSGDQLLKMVGKCTHEKQEYRAAKNTYSVERHVWLTKLNNLRILSYGNERALTAEEKTKLINLPYEKSKLTFKQVKQKLNLDEKVVFKFSGKSEDKDTFMELKAFHEIRKAVEKDKNQWQIIKSSPVLMDAIGTAFSVYKVDDEIQQALLGKDDKFIDLLNKTYPDITNKLQELDKSTIDELINNINFDKFSNLSLLALSKILPHMGKGKRYDEAVGDIYPNTNTKNPDNKFLPAIDGKEINNPVVIRSLSQVRKLINAVIAKYGSPVKINIELARDVGKSKKVRDEIDKANKNNKAENDRLREEFEGQFKREPKKYELIKYKLYKEQHCKCLYSDKPICISRLLEQSYVEVDHALPYSRTFDDSLNNKVLCLSQANQNKGNKTPYEWFGDGSKEWERFKKLVDSTSFTKYKKQYLLTQKINEKDFKERNLNDTKYIARFLKNFIEDNLEFNNINIDKPDENKKDKIKKKVVCTNGRITSFLRKKWGLNKDREESDRHHALDACVIACSNDSLIQKVVKYYKLKENRYNSQEFLENKYQFPAPWEFFRDEVKIRVFSDNPEQDLKDKVLDRFNKIEQKYLRSLFVSRAPRRKISGKVHDETMRSAKYLDKDISTNRVSIDKLTLKNLKKDDLHDKERNENLYYLLKNNAFIKYNGNEISLNEYIENKYKSKKENLIFKEPLYLSEKDKLANRAIKKVTLKTTQESGFDECEKFKKIKAIADNATMVRADIFYNKGKYYAVPIYLWQINLPQAPNISTNGKDVLKEGFNFKFSLYKNDLIKVDTKGSHPDKEVYLYYSSININSSILQLKTHDSNYINFNPKKVNKNKKGKPKFIEYPFQNFKTFEKYTVDILGNKFKVKLEQRQWFKNSNKNLDKDIN